MAISYVQAAFVPTAGVEYYITQFPSNMVVGASGTYAVLQTAVNDISQPITFTAVSGKADTYTLKNRQGNYLNKLSTNKWDVVFEAAINGLYSEWVIIGDVSTSIRFSNNGSAIDNGVSNFLAPDSPITSGTGLWANKAADNANGVFSLVIAPSPVAVLTLLQKEITIEIEKGLRTYPLFVKAIFFTDNIDVTASAGYTIDKNTITPADFAAGLVKIEINTTAAIGDTGKVVFSSTHLGVTTRLDSVKVTPVATYTRYFIQHVIGGLVIGNNSITGAPALTTYSNDISQKFLLRPVHPALTDSMYYIIHDDDYKLLRKLTATTYNTEYGFFGDEAKWTLKTQADKKLSITNFVTGKELGTDGITVDSPIYDNKTWSAGSYHEWVILTTIPVTGLQNSLAHKLFATISTQLVNLQGTNIGDIVKVYNVSGQLVKQVTANSSVTSINLKSGIYIIKVNADVLKVRL